MTQNICVCAFMGSVMLSICIIVVDRVVCMLWLRVRYIKSSSSCIISVDVDCYVHRTSSRYLSSSPSLSDPMVICQQSC